MTFTHVVMFKWRNPAEVDGDALAAALRGAVARVDGVRSYLCGTDIGLSPGNNDFAIVGTFDSREHFLAYRDDAEHQRIIAEMILPNAESRNAVQLEQ